MTQSQRTLRVKAVGVDAVVSLPAGLEARIRDEWADLGLEAFQDVSTARVQVRINDMAGEAADPLAVGLADLTRAVIDASPCVCIHAAVVSSTNAVLAFPGASGLGKSTLTAALVRQGFAYVSDEALALDPVSLSVCRFSRPLALDSNSWSVLSFDGPPPLPGAEAFVRASSLGRLEETDRPLTDVVVARREPGTMQLVPSRRSAAVVVLVQRSFNHFRAPRDTFRTVVAAVRECRVWQATYSDAPAFARMLADQFDVSTAR